MNSFKDFCARLYFWKIAILHAHWHAHINLYFIISVYNLECLLPVKRRNITLLINIIDIFIWFNNTKDTLGIWFRFIDVDINGWNRSSNFAHCVVKISLWQLMRCPCTWRQPKRNNFFKKTSLNYHLDKMLHYKTE